MSQRKAVTRAMALRYRSTSTASIPFSIKGIDSDNGSEFINEHLLKYCSDNKITFTRSRPGNKNDSWGSAAKTERDQQAD
jgi:transposase InsO family protein